jgi:hypothetical protein
VLSTEVVSTGQDTGVVDSPSALGPPLKLARLEQGEKEVWTSEAAQGGAGKVAVTAEEVPATPSLQQQALADLQVATGPRSRAIPYTRRASNTSTPASASRKSARNQGQAGTSALIKAQRMTAERNLEDKCKEKGTFAEPISLLPDYHLASVILDSGMVFRPKDGEPVAALSVVRAKELVQASLAATALRLAREAAARAAAVLADGSGETPAARELRSSPAGIGGSALAADTGPAQRLLVDEGEELGETHGRGLQPGSVGETHSVEAGGLTEEAEPAKPRRRRGRKSTLTVRKGSHKRKGVQCGS